MGWYQLFALVLLFILAISACGMPKFIAGPLTQPATAGPELETWTSQNALAMTWLFNSMKPTIRRTFLLLDTPYKIWIMWHKPIPIVPIRVMMLMILS